MSRMVLSNFLPPSSLSSIKLIFHSFQLHVNPRIWNLSTTDLNLHNCFALAVLVGFQNCFQSKRWSKWKLYSPPWFSLPVLPKSLVVVAGYQLCASSPLLYTHLASLVGHSLALHFIWTRSQASPFIFFQLQPVWLSKREKYSTGIISL